MCSHFYLQQMLISVRIFPCTLVHSLFIYILAINARYKRDKQKEQVIQFQSHLTALFVVLIQKVWFSLTFQQQS